MPPQKYAIEFFVTLSGLIIIAFVVSILYAFLPKVQDFVNIPALQRPTTIWRLARLFALCVCVGFAEEGVFRLFLPARFEKAGAQPAAADGFAAALFGCFHSWEGAAGVLNAIAAALFLSSRFRLHGSLTVIALSHACYNFFAYVIS